MFAIAIWDEKQRKLILVRDRLGQKPLVYYQDGGRIVFASELKSILAAGNVAADIRPEAIDEYLMYGYVPHPKTVYQNIYKLPPAHLAVFDRGGFAASAVTGTRICNRTQRMSDGKCEPR